MREDGDAMSSLYTAAEKAKATLSTSSQAVIYLKSLFGGKKFHFTLTRADFEKLNENLFQQTIEVVSNTLAASEIDKAEIHNIVLVGGSTRIPRIRSMLQLEFPGKDLEPDCQCR